MAPRAPRPGDPGRALFTQPGQPPRTGRPDQVIYYQYKADRARRTLRGIDEQVAKAEKAVDGPTPVKRNRFIQLTGGTKSVNRALEAKARALAGLKGYITNLQACPTAPRSPGVRHRALPTSCSAHREGLPDVQARPAGRPIYHRKRDSIEAHLTIVFAALAVSHWIETKPAGASRNSSAPPPLRTVTIQAAPHHHRRRPLPDDLHAALARISNRQPGCALA